MSLINKALLIIILISISQIVIGQDKLNHYLVIAAENNPGLKASFAEYMATLEKVNQVGTLPDPQLAFAYFIQPVETRNGPQEFKISISQMFPWFGTLSSKEELIKNKAKAKYETFEEKKSKLFFEIKSSYYSLYFIKKGIDITNENIQILETFKNLALIKIESGTASAVDGLRANMEIADLENKLAFLKDKLNVQQAKFNNLLNVGVEEPIFTPDTLWLTDIQFSKKEVIDSLEQNNHQLLKIDYLMASFKSQEKLVKKNGLPKFSIGLDYIGIGKSDNAMSAENNGQDAIVFPKIGITIPIYRKKYKAMVAEAVFMQESTENLKADKQNILETLVEKAYSQYSDAVRRIELNKNQAKLAHQAINILESDYATMGKNFEEILRMEKRKLKYDLEYQKALADKQAEIAFIQYLMGK